MYNDENVVWTNQQIYFYKDKIYNSNGSLEVTISNNTQTDFKYFSTTTLNIKVSFENDFKTNKQCSLNISKVNDLIESIKNLPEIEELYKNNDIEIVKRYNNDRDLIFKFKESKTTKEKCVLIAIFYNESNFTNVVIPYFEFQILLKLLINFNDNYFERTFQLNQQSIQIEQLKYLRKLESSIKSLPSLLSDLSKNKPNNTEEINYEVPSQIPEAKTNNILEELNTTSNPKEKLINELDSFIGGSEMNNIEIPGIEKDEKRSESKEPISKREIESILIDKVLKNDITVLEDILNSSYTKSNPLSSIMEIFSISSDNIFKKEISDITTDDNKSLLFLSNLIFKSILRNYLDNNISIPSTIPMLKYKSNLSSEIPIHNQFLAIDLLLIHSYLKTYRSKIESKTDDITYTKSLTYLAFRCFTDSLSFTILEKLSTDFILTSVLDRFEYYKNKGFFSKYEENLKYHQLKEIEKNDINSFLNNVIKFISNTKGSMYVDNLQEEYIKKGEIKLPTKNNFNIEQINEIIKIEVSRKVGKKEEEIIKQIIDPEIIKLYSNSKDSDNNKKTNLRRFIESNIKEVPEIIKTNFLIYIDSLGNNNFDINQLQNFKLIDVGENILKSLYLWKPSEDDKICKNYIYFTDKIKNINLNKQDIINILNKKENKDSEWNNLTLESFE